MVMKFIGDRLVRKEGPRLVQGRGRYVGQPRATTPRRTRALIDVSWEPLASVQDPTAPGDARVHDDIPDNLAGRVTLSCGDVASALAAATAVRSPAPGEGVAAHRS